MIVGLGLALAALAALPLTAQERAVVPLEARTSPAFESALERDTRSPDGRPGSRYWQQRVHYDIRATVDPAAKLVTAEGTVAYTNASPDTLGGVVFHLYQNLFQAQALKIRPVPITGGVIVERLAADGVELPLPAAADPSLDPKEAGVPPDTAGPVRIAGTVMGVRLPEPLPPGGTATFAVCWRFTIPEGEGVPRMGMADSTTGQIAQWYPQVATYDDLTGWDARPYLSNGEFYLEYGDFDLALTAPAGFVVAATGELANPEAVLPKRVRDRLERAARADTVVQVLTRDDFGPGKATRGRPGETLTWRFEAEDVRDVAFAFGDHYLWDATSAVVEPARAGRPARRTAVHAVYRPDAASWPDAARMTKDAIETFSRNVHPYVYPHITSSEGRVGGMEYPMLVFVRNFETEQRTQRVIAHEVGHEWFPMMVGSDETAYAWMDEGVNTFITIFAAEHYDPASPERSEVRERYRRYSRETQRSFSLMDPPDAVAAGGGEVSVLGYRKPATALLALREILGAGIFDRALTEFTRRWLFKHPAPWDFFNTFEDVARQDLDWFWQPWFFGAGVSDLALTDVRVEAGGPAGTSGSGRGAGQGEGAFGTTGDDREELATGTAGATPPEAGASLEHRVTVTVRNEGTVLSPVRVRITTAEGDTVSVGAPADVWFDGSTTAAIQATVRGEVAKVELDPQGLFADVDPSDDAWTPDQGDAGRLEHPRD